MIQIFDADMEIHSMMPTQLPPTGLHVSTQPYTRLQFPLLLQPGRSTTDQVVEDAAASKSMMAKKTYSSI